MHCHFDEAPLEHSVLSLHLRTSALFRTASARNSNCTRQTHQAFLGICDEPIQDLGVKRREGALLQERTTLPFGQGPDALIQSMRVQVAPLAHSSLGFKQMPPDSPATDADLEPRPATIKSQTGGVSGLYLSSLDKRLTRSLPSLKSTLSQPFKEKCICKVVRIGSFTIIHLSKL